jgi:hypothetical protein
MWDNTQLQNKTYAVVKQYISAHMSDRVTYG